MQLGLFSYFVQSIAAKWYVFTNKKEAGEAANVGKGILDEVREKALQEEACASDIRLISRIKNNCHGREQERPEGKD